jgi:fused signal recognition particle receptor
MPSSDSQAPAGGLLAKLKSRLNRGKRWLQTDLAGKRLDEATLEDLETRLLMADVGVPATTALTEKLRAARSPLTGPQALEAAVAELLEPVDKPLAIAGGPRPFVVLVVGVNGTGKTTTIGKLAHRLRAERRNVMLAAADTFRAAAIEQLQEWGERTDSPVIAQAHGADPAAVVHDALGAARARDVDVLLIDTAGRMHTAGGLMDELKKIKRVIGRIDPSAPHETLLVLDASQGQNALRQAQEFDAALGLTGLAITKLDGTAKGGILLAVARELAVPIRFVGVGEGVEDLEPFRAREFAQALVGT